MNYVQRKAIKQPREQIEKVNGMNMAVTLILGQFQPKMNNIIPERELVGVE